MTPLQHVQSQCVAQYALGTLSNMTIAAPMMQRYGCRLETGFGVSCQTRRARSLCIQSLGSLGLKTRVLSARSRRQGTSHPWTRSH